jgi:hypothetical protein
VHVDLGCVEGALALGDDVGDVGGLDRHLQRGLGLVPLGDLADELVGARRQLGLELVEAEVAQQLQHELQQARELVGQLLGGAEDVRVVLGEPAGPQQAVDDA